MILITELVIQLKLWNWCFKSIQCTQVFGSINCDDSLSQQIRIWRHANQLINSKHLQSFLSLQNGLSVWFTRLHNHGEDWWSDSCPEDNHWHPFTRRVSHKHSLPKKLAVHRVLYPSMLTESWVEGKSVEEKDAQPTERTAALWGLSSKIDSRIWDEINKEWTEARVKASRATTHRRVKEFGYNCRQWRLTWAKEKKN